MVVVAGVLVGAVLGVCALVLKAEDGSHPLPQTIAGVVGGYLFLAAGAVAHARDPTNRVGLLMVLAGAAYFAEDVQLAKTTWMFGVGLLLAQASTGPLTHLLLAFPDGRLTSRAQRVLAGVTYAVVLGIGPLCAPFNDTSELPAGRVNPLYIWGSRSMIETWSRINAAIGAVVGAGVLAVLTHRWLTASGPRRRVLAPVFVTGLVGAAATVASGLGPGSSPLRPALLWVYLVAFALLPLGFLAGIPRLRFGRTRFGTLLAQLATPLPHAELRALLASALGDPSLRIAYWRPETASFVDENGQPLDVEAPGEDLARPGQRPRSDRPTMRLVERDGRRVAALLHDPALREDPRRLDAVVAAAGLALDNQRLAAEVRAQLAEVRASRGRIVAAADAERRRIERDLHDGAQQRLIIARLAVRMAQDQRCAPELAALLARAADGLDLAIRELRELARGIHPEILTEAGLVAAVEALVDRVPLDVRVVAADVPRLPAAVEATAYFVAAEAVTNVLHHAAATRVTIEIGHGGGRLRVAVTDDGAGGADLAAGTGLLGLRDRVSALDGTLVVHSPPGRGTTVRADLPAAGG
ncbi:histidine kinase [Pseudofrankia sp. BMG5.36]|nr:histidine kinase [Pseudofrankia sp. BMG5.36]